MPAVYGASSEIVTGKRTCHLRLLLLIHLGLVRIQMLERMRTRTTRATNSRGHDSQHCSSLCDLWSSWTRHSHMHLLRHSKPWLTTGLLWMTWCHWMARGYAWMLWYPRRMRRVCLGHTSCHHSGVNCGSPRGTTRTENVSNPQTLPPASSGQANVPPLR
jgi:hypothetical protein